MHWSWSWTRILIGLLIIKSLGNAGEGGGDRSLHWKSRSFPYANRIETCSSWKWRWPRLLRITSSATHTYVDFPTRSMYQDIGTWPITEKRVCLDSGYTSATNWEIACMMEIVSWIRVTGQFLCLRVGDASVMNNFWSVIREFHLFRGHNCHHLVSKFI